MRSKLFLAAMLIGLNAGAAAAQTAAPAAPAPASKAAISKACSAKADAQGLHGKARKKFRSECRRNGGM